MTVEEFTALLVEALRRHDAEGEGFAYIDLETGCIDGYFKLKLVAEDMLAAWKS